MKMLAKIRVTEKIVKITAVMFVFFITASFNYYTVLAQEYTPTVPEVEESEEIYIEDEPQNQEERIYNFEAEKYLVDEYLLVNNEASEYDEENEEEEEIRYFRTTANLRLRTAPSTYADVVRTVQSGSRVTVYDQRDGVWFYVSHNGAKGYMYAEFLTPIPNISGEADSDVSINGVELLSWDYVRNNVIRNGVYLHVTDVRTGITFLLTAFSQGNHADVVPVSREDTDAIRQAFGGRWSWEPRAVLVTVDGRTIAASINGMPHGGTPRSGNGMAGHICMHFYGSRTHNGNRSHERDHQNRVQEAFNAG